jgi:hypothetical protein
MLKHHSKENVMSETNLFKDVVDEKWFENATVEEIKSVLEILTKAGY